MDDKDHSDQKGRRKKLVNIISKLAENQLNKTSKNEDEDSPSNKTLESKDAEMAVAESTPESKRKSKRKPEKTLKASHNHQNDEEPEVNLTIVKTTDSDEDIVEHVDVKDEIFVDEERETSKKKRKISRKDSHEDNVLPKIINCSACSKSIHTKPGKLCRHPDLNTLVCKQCNKFYSSGKFTRDEYGVEEYCRWCADGGDLICCDFCEKAFCKDCIKRNLGKSKLKELLGADEDEQWSCFCCDPDPISSKILLCNRIMRFLDDKKDRHTPYKDKKGREIIHGPNTSERRNLLTSIAGEQTIKTEDSSKTSFSKKTYSKRFQNGLDSMIEENGQDSEESAHVKKELKEAEKDEMNVISSDEEEEGKGAKKQRGNQSQKKNKDEKKPKKLRGSKKKSDKEKETGDSSDNEKSHSGTKSRGKISKTKSSRNKALESDSDNDFVSMVKKDGTKYKKDSKKSKSGNKKKKKNSESNVHSSEDASDKQSDEESDKEESSEESNAEKHRQSRRRKFSSSSSKEDRNKSDSDDEDLIPLKRKKNRTRKIEKKKGKANKRWSLRVKDVKSEESDSDDESDEETPKKRKGKKQKRGKKKNKKKKRKRKDDDEEEEDEDDDDDENMSPSKRAGRKKIRKILNNEKLEEATKHARKLEEERRQRLLERTKNTIFEKPASVDLKEVVLEFNSDGKTPLIAVDQELVKHMKPHQVEGVKFMYDCTIESVKNWEEKEEDGAGCILAHVMGLGKTLQVVTLVHTLYRSELIQLRRILVVCPLNTVLNWQVEFEKWLSVDERLDIYLLNEAGSNNWNRADMLQRWHKYGGVLIMGYTMYRNLSQCCRIKSKHQKKIFKESLVDPGPELVICDEGHILRNCKSGISLAMNAIKTKRRIVLTGTPLQNNLLEYHCMVSFVKPNLLGTLKEFSNSFIHPIKNGQCADSTDNDVRIMKSRCHVLHKMLKGCVQRKDYADIAQFLPPKLEYAIKIRLSEKQREMYKYYLETFLIADSNDGFLRPKGASLFSDYQALMRIWTHPWSLKLESARQIERFIDTDDSIADFVVESGEEEESASSEEMSWTSDSSENNKGEKGEHANASGSSSSKSDNSEDSQGSEKKRNKGKGTKSRSLATKNSPSVKVDPDQPSTSSIVIDDDITEETPHVPEEGYDSGTLRSGQEFKEEIKPEEEWYDKFLKDEDETNIEIGSKIVLLLEILADADALEEKVLVFSHSLVSLDLIEKALGGGQIGGNKADWCRGCDYFRMDGSTSVQMRKRWSDIFNDEENKAARLFLISTKAGGLGINLIGASRVIVFDISWNPSHDVQSIFRSYRFGQNRPVFVYRFIAQGTMEEKIYDRQVTKLSVSQRVVDEHQIERHFKANDLAELYRFDPDILENENDERPILAIPKDPILAELINRLYPKWIVKYHEHDSLLRNRPEEELSEAERKEAWDSYEAEKEGIKNRARLLADGVNTFNDMVNAMNAETGNTIRPPSVSIGVPNATNLQYNGINPNVQTVNRQQHIQLQQQQQIVLEDQRRRLFEYERQRVIDTEKRREEELHKRGEALRQMEIRRQEDIRARRAREHELEEQRRQQIDAQQSRQFLQQLLHNRGNQSAYVTQQTGIRGFPPGQPTYRVVVAPRAQAPRRSPPRIIELPPDA